MKTQTSDFVDLAPLLENAPANCWLAFDRMKMRVVGQGPVLREVIAEAIAAGEENPVLFWSPPAAPHGCLGRPD